MGQWLHAWRGDYVRSLELGVTDELLRLSEVCLLLETAAGPADVLVEHQDLVVVVFAWANAHQP